MTTRNLLDADNIPARARGAELGPSDSSDSGSDLQGLDLDDTSDRNGTGEHLSADSDEDIREADDISPDRIVRAQEAGLGSGLDQAEEAQLGVTDEELASRRARGR